MTAAALGTFAAVPLRFGFAAHAQVAGPGLRLSEAGRGIDRTVTIESTGEFRLVFEAADNWGLAQWYDLSGDPAAKTDLLSTHIGISPDVAEPALFQQVYYGAYPEDPKLYQRASKSYFPNTPRSFAIVENTPSRIVVEATSHPVENAIGVLLNLTVSVRYDIRPDGLILVTSRHRAKETQPIKTWLCAIVGLCDPTFTDPRVPPDRSGWLRSSARQQPYDYVERAEPFLYAYWDPKAQPPYTDWTRASVMLAPLGGDLMPTRHYPHGWKGFKRWGYARERVVIPAGATISQNYAIKLGSTASKTRPALDSAEACRKVLASLRS